MGGHGVPEATIRQRYLRSVKNFFGLYRPMVSTWQVFDNTREGMPQLVAYGEETGSETIRIEAIWQQIQEVLL
jgi:predicted ABC-type ATPase